MQSSNPSGKQRIAVALSQLTTRDPPQPSGAQLKLIFVDKKGLETLLEMVQVRGGRQGCLAGWGGVLARLARCELTALSRRRLPGMLANSLPPLPDPVSLPRPFSLSGPAHAGRPAAHGGQEPVPPGRQLLRDRPAVGGRHGAARAQGRVGGASGGGCLLAALISGAAAEQADLACLAAELIQDAAFQHSRPAPLLTALPQVILGGQFVNNPKLSDVTFIIEGRPFHAHRIALLASSEIFKTMFDGERAGGRLAPGLHYRASGRRTRAGCALWLAASWMPASSCPLF